MWAQRTQARPWKEKEAGVEEGLGLPGRPDAPWLIFLHGLPDVSGTENSYKENFLLLGFISGVSGPALVKVG